MRGKIGRIYNFLLAFYLFHLEILHPNSLKKKFEELFWYFWGKRLKIGPVVKIVGLFYPIPIIVFLLKMLGESFQTIGAKIKHQRNFPKAKIRKQQIRYFIRFSENPRESCQWKIPAKEGISIRRNDWIVLSRQCWKSGSGFDVKCMEESQ